jgi:carbamoyl-phosphate synthase small subunit
VKGFVALEDGTLFEGESFGAPGEAVGEVVFNTSMTGYQEILTDPSYASQIVTMTYPLIGNYGVNPADVESGRVQVAGFIVKEACPYPSNFTCTQSLGDYLKASRVIGVSGIDTRALTRKLRITGAMKGVIYAGEKDPGDLVDKARAWRGMVDLDLVKVVTCPKSYVWKEPQTSDASSDKRFSVVAMDFGMKYNQLRILSKLGCKVTVVPGTASAKEILSHSPDGVFLSNGPGDPGAVTYAIEAVKQLLDKKPIFGICLGHQIIGLALGGSRFKLKFGHRGANHPVKNLATGSIEITSQNHGFCIEEASLEKIHVRMTHVNLNDHTCEGIEDKANRVFSVQYHPEAAPGPHDSAYLFEQFIAMMEKN